jgi:hypothetical protein
VENIEEWQVKCVLGCYNILSKLLPHQYISLLGDTLDKITNSYVDDTLQAAQKGTFWLLKFVTF